MHYHELFFADSSHDLDMLKQTMPDSFPTINSALVDNSLYKLMILDENVNLRTTNIFTFSVYHKTCNSFMIWFTEKGAKETTCDIIFAIKNPNNAFLKMSLYDNDEKYICDLPFNEDFALPICGLLNSIFIRFEHPLGYSPPDKIDIECDIGYLHQKYRNDIENIIFPMSCYIRKGIISRKYVFPRTHGLYDRNYPFSNVSDSYKSIEIKKEVIDEVYYI